MTQSRYGGPTIESRTTFLFPGNLVHSPHI